jgi:ATP-binding cassette subfamily B protein
MKTDRELLGRLWPHARPDRHLFVLALVLTPFAMVGALVQPLMLKRALDEHIVPGELANLDRLAMAYALVTLLTYLVEGAYMLALAHAGQRTIVRLRDSVYQQLLSLAPAFFDKRPAGALLTRAISDVESLGEALTAGVVTIVLDVLVVLGVLAVMFTMDWRLTLLLLLVSPPLLFVLQVCRLRLRDCFLLVREQLAQVNAFLAERLAGVEVVQLFSHEEASLAEFKRRNRAYRDTSIRSNTWDALMFAVVDSTGRICIALLLWYGSSEVLSGTVTAGLLVAFIDYLDRLFRPLQQFSGKVAVIQRATAALEKIFALLDDGTRIEDSGVEPARVEGRIQLRNVRFAYEPGQDVLHGIDLDLAPGEVVALVGHTGCGKTTISRLLTRAYDGYRGSITLDGVEISTIRPAALRRHVAAVHQDVHLFGDTIAFNVGMGADGMNEDRLRAAAALVHADSLVEGLADGWSHELRERGANLSSGQGQLLTFARTMAYDPVVVILDEATASVDSVTEALVQNAVSKILEKKTVLVIAHRLSTITKADRIVVLDGGRVIEQGNHSMLLARNGRYADLVRKGLGAVG